MNTHERPMMSAGKEAGGDTLREVDRGRLAKGPGRNLSMTIRRIFMSAVLQTMHRNGVFTL